MITKVKIFLVAFLALFTVQSISHAAEENPLLTSWLTAQTNIQTWSADFEQTRTLKSFTRPLISTGRVWFAAPNRFHWELGNPAQTIAIRQPEQLLVIYPKLKRVEKYSMAGKLTGPWKDAMALLEAGFPRDKKELEKHFKIESVTVTNAVCEVALQPKSAAARKMMPGIKLAFGTSDFSLRATELQFADGSTLRNDFKSPVLNEKLDEVLFSPKLESDYKVVEPMQKK